MNLFWANVHATIVVDTVTSQKNHSNFTVESIPFDCVPSNDSRCVYTITKDNRGCGQKVGLFYEATFCPHPIMQLKGVEYDKDQTHYDGVFTDNLSWMH